jgi:hypothetical protein
MPKHKNARSCPKTLYRVRNWSEYDQALVHRGSITIWLAEDFGKNWHYAGEKQHDNTHLETQTTQARICCAALNRMTTHLGMPDSYKVPREGVVA